MAAGGGAPRKSKMCISHTYSDFGGFRDKIDFMSTYPCGLMKLKNLIGFGTGGAAPRSIALPMSFLPLDPQGDQDVRPATLTVLHKSDTHFGSATLCDAPNLGAVPREPARSGAAGAFSPLNKAVNRFGFWLRHEPVSAQQLTGRYY